MGYDLEPIHIPRMAGLSLTALIATIESGATRWALMPTLLKNAGVPRLRQAELVDAPSVYPRLPRRGDAAPEEGDPLDLDGIAERASVSASGFAFETASDLARAYRAGDATPEQVARALLDQVVRADQMDPPMRGVIAWDEEDLMAQARASAERFERGEPLGPLDGIPVFVKDEIDQRGYPTTVGTRFLGRESAREDATVVGRLRAAGALLPGKTNMHEIGLGVTGLNIHHGTPRNPYAPDHHTGGSSSGVAAVVAQGLCPLAVGADGGGSIRIPASLCGVVGLKATFSRISEHGAFPVCWSVGHVGPIGATAADVALGYAVMAGPDPHDPGTLLQPPVTLEGVERDDVEGLRIGVYDPWFDDADEATVGACRAMLDALVERGAELRAVEIPQLNLTRVAHSVTIISEMLTTMAPYLREHRTELGPDVRSNLVLAAALTAADYVRAQRVRTALTRRLERIYREVDIIATPTTGMVAPAIAADALRGGESDLGTLSALMRFIIPANMAGNPAITVPAGYDEAGLPIGFHAMGRPWEEALLLRLARIAEQVVPRRAPAVHRRLLGD